jgi:23S rRNA pseudouridine1911/1915/1917 synthase
MITPDDLLEVQDDAAELFEHYRFTVDKGQEPLRIDKFLFNRIGNISRNRIQQAAEAGNILVKGKAVKSNYQIKPLDDITIVLPYPPHENELIPEDLPLNVVYEDDHVLVINKAAGMVVHPGKGNYSGTLVNALVFRFQGLPGFGKGSDRPGLVHRIDKDTSGLLVVAKNEIAHNKLARQFFEKTTGRLYNALVWGVPEPKSGTIEGNLGRSPKDRIKMTIFPEGDQGKTAVTHYKMLESFLYTSLIECRLETGRTHQIRAHFEYIRHPLFNDAIYGGNRMLKGNLFAKYKQFVDNCFEAFPRHALHARTLSFRHPATGEIMEFESPMPDDFVSLIARWKNYADNYK